jgi:hypothetical protein
VVYRDRVLDVARNFSERDCNDALQFVAVFDFSEGGMFTAGEQGAVPEDMVLDATDGTPQMPDATWGSSSLGRPDMANVA